MRCITRFFWNVSALSDLEGQGMFEIKADMAKSKIAEGGIVGNGEIAITQPLIFPFCWHVRLLH